MIRKALILYLLLVIFFTWGFVAVQYQVFPGRIIMAIEHRARALLVNPESESSKPASALESPQDSVPESSDDSAQISEVAATVEKSPLDIHMVAAIANNRKYTPIDAGGFDPAAAAVLFSTEQQQRGYRMIYGTFDLPNQPHAAILLDSGNRVVHSWNITETALDSLSDEIAATIKSSPVSFMELWPQGILVERNGTVIVNSYHPDLGLAALDVCGKILWNRTGSYREVVQPGLDKDSIWVVDDYNLARIDRRNGEILQSLTLNDIHLANPDVAVFTARRGLRLSSWHNDPVHLIDVEPLAQSLSEKFPDFETGDLLLSYRTLNLIMVVDPATAIIKWWRAGASLRQSDADWGVDGTISVLNNNFRDNRETGDGNLPDMDTRYTQVLGINPKTMQVQTELDGGSEQLYSGFHGKFQRLPNGNILLASPEQGRVVEISSDGEVVFDFLNRYDENRVLHVSEAVWLPEDFFEVDFSELNCL
jgi:hypothetical protein